MSYVGSFLVSLGTTIVMLAVLEAMRRRGLRPVDALATLMVGPASEVVA